jgi:hypothetical protein
MLDDAAGDDADDGGDGGDANDEAREVEIPYRRLS